jgi:hypothetical protein
VGLFYLLEVAATNFVHTGVRRYSKNARKIGFFGIVADEARNPPGPAGYCGLIDSGGAGAYGAACFSIVRPILRMLSAITPSPTQRFIPASPL